MINFMKYRLFYVVLSALILVPGIFCLLQFGLKPALDFTGGSLMEFKVNSPSTAITGDMVRETVGSAQIEVGSVTNSGDSTFILKTKTLESAETERLLSSLKTGFGEITVLRQETVGPVLGKELLQKTFVATLIAVSVILLYIAWAFKNFRFGVSAIVALAHDVLVVVGIFAILGKTKGIEVDALFVTALLTTMSFSVHDTIVVFDRIRELSHKSTLPFVELINQALSETMGRSLNNSLTIIFMLLALFLMGGETVRWFVFALLVGTISGTYSSPFVAVPILYQWSLLGKKKTNIESA